MLRDRDTRSIRIQRLDLTMRTVRNGSGPIHSRHQRRYLTAKQMEWLLTPDDLEALKDRGVFISKKQRVSYKGTRFHLRHQWISGKWRKVKMG